MGKKSENKIKNRKKENENFHKNKKMENILIFQYFEILEDQKNKSKATDMESSDQIRN